MATVYGHLKPQASYALVEHPFPDLVLLCRYKTLHSSAKDFDYILECGNGDLPINP